MTLHEEFKLYEDLFDDIDKPYKGITTSADYHDWRYKQSRKPYTKNFGRKEYDLTDSKQLHDWVEANVQFQMKRYPSKYTDASNIKSLRYKILKQLIWQLERDGADARIIADIEDRMKYGIEQDRKDTIIKHKSDARKIVNAFYDTFVKACDQYCPNELTDNEKEAGKSALVDACFNILEKNTERYNVTTG